MTQQGQGARERESAEREEQARPVRLPPRRVERVQPLPVATRPERLPPPARPCPPVRPAVSVPPQPDGSRLKPCEKIPRHRRRARRPSPGQPGSACSAFHGGSRPGRRGGHSMGQGDSRGGSRRYHPGFWRPAVWPRGRRMPGNRDGDDGIGVKPLGRECRFTTHKCPCGRRERRRNRPGVATARNQSDCGRSRAGFSRPAACLATRPSPPRPVAGREK